MISFHHIVAIIYIDHFLQSDPSPGEEGSAVQKDVHFYLTYALGMRMGIQAQEIELIAWADQYTDELTQPEPHGLQTQTSTLGNWAERQIQATVIMPFHFIPGDDPLRPWMTTPGSSKAKSLLKAAEGEPLGLGIALHAYQDTFSHQGFSGWEEPLNQCFPWYSPEAALPNVGHAELRAIPDVVNYVWTDPRSGVKVDNKERAMQAAKGTWDCLSSIYAPQMGSSQWASLKPALKEIFGKESYDERVDALCRLSGNPQVHYREVCTRMISLYQGRFANAAALHLSRVLDLCRDLPWGR